MNRFAFIVHPLEAADIARKYPIAGKLPPRFVEWGVYKFIKPKFVSNIVGIRSEHDGREVEGIFVGCPMTSRIMVDEPAEKTLPVIIETAKLAQDLGAQIVGLGAMTSVVGDAGITIAENLDIAVTTGNTYTVATALEGARKAAELMDVPLERAHVAVLGATGAIGRVCAQIMAAEAGELTLLVRDAGRGEALAEELRPEARGTVAVSTDLDAALPRADVVICVSSAAEAIVRPDHLKIGAVVCDVARPRDVSREVAKQRDDVLVIEGGVVRPPGDVDFGFDFGFPAGLSYACMAETALLALVGRFEHYSLGRTLDRAKVDEISGLAALHGFRLAGFRSFERAVADDVIAAIRDRARSRRGQATARPEAATI